MDNDEIKPIIQLLTDGLVNSIVEIVTFKGVNGLESKDLQYLMENLCNMKSLKKLHIQSIPIFYRSDIPFLVECAEKTTADIIIQLERQPSVNIQNIVRNMPTIEKSDCRDNGPIMPKIGKTINK